MFNRLIVKIIGDTKVIPLKHKGHFQPNTMEEYVTL